MIAGDVTLYLYQCVSLKQWTHPMKRKWVPTLFMPVTIKSPSLIQKRNACHDNRPVVDIHHISHKSQWTKPLNEAIVSKIHIGTGTESYLQRSSFDSVHFLEFYFFFFASRYGMVEFLFLLFRR